MKHNIVIVSLMVVVIVMIAIPVWIGTQAADQGETQSGQEQPRTPPQAAIAACSGKTDGAACEFTSPRGDKKTGTCESKQDLIACKPNDKLDSGQQDGNSQGQPNSGQQGDNSQGQPNSGQQGNSSKTPPQKAIDACTGKSDGAACEFISPRGDNMTGTCETRENLSACKPNTAPQDGGKSKKTPSGKQNKQGK